MYFPKCPHLFCNQVVKRVCNKYVKQKKKIIFNMGNKHRIQGIEYQRNKLYLASNICPIWDINELHIEEFLWLESFYKRGDLSVIEVLEGFI